jgi:transcriptional regulator with XRE-family HTH domain
MTNVKELITRLKEVREEKQLSYGDIMELMEKNGDFIAKSTLSRVFAEGSEELSFKFEETLKPIANAILDIDTIEDTDNMDVQAMKYLLKVKEQIIEERDKQISTLESELDKEKLKHHDKLDKEREQYSKRIEFLMKQIELKDNRIDQLLEAVFIKDKQQKDLLDNIIHCPHGRKILNED